MTSCCLINIPSLQILCMFSSPDLWHRVRCPDITAINPKQIIARFHLDSWGSWIHYYWKYIGGLKQVFRVLSNFVSQTHSAHIFWWESVQTKNFFFQIQSLLVVFASTPYCTGKDAGSALLFLFFDISWWHKDYIGIMKQIGMNPTKFCNFWISLNLALTKRECMSKFAKLMT